MHSVIDIQYTGLVLCNSRYNFDSTKTNVRNKVLKI